VRFAESFSDLADPDVMSQALGVTDWLIGKPALVRFGDPAHEARAAPVCLRLPPPGSLGALLAASRSALPGGTDDEVS
jgi:hypothetical protein